MLYTNSNIGELIFNSYGVFEFYSCDNMRHEIQKHWDKLKKISKLSDSELDDLRFRVFSEFQFIDEKIIPEKTWVQAEILVKDIDIDDIDFVALTKHIKGYLWTGDKQLYSGLKKKGFKRVLNTIELLEMRKKRLDK